MLRVLEFMTGFYWILIPQFIIQSLFRTRLQDASGSADVLIRVLRGATGMNGAVFYTPLDGAWNGWNIEKLLKRYDIPIWGWGYAFNQFYFRVHIDDADDAFYIMWDAGVDILN